MKRSEAKEVKDWKLYVGTRCLVVEHYYTGYSGEVNVLEISPSGKRVKLKFPTGAATWNDAEDFLLLEVLQDSKNG